MNLDKRQTYQYDLFSFESFFIYSAKLLTYVIPLLLVLSEYDCGLISFLAEWVWCGGKGGNPAYE